MIYADRAGKICEKTTGQDKFLAFVYAHTLTRLLLRPMLSPWASRLGGCLLSTRASSRLIFPFVRKHHIDLSQYEKCEYSSYNDFFTRKIRPDKRPVVMDSEILITPGDGKISAYPITEDGRFFIKNTSYTVKELLCDGKLARHYVGGWIYVLRLSVCDYHRNCYVADGQKSAQRRIPGVFHTVNPVANDHYPIYKMNTREYCLLRNKELGSVLMMEVGALMVGKICNYHLENRLVGRGEEKGCFEFGGSTIVLMTEPGRVLPDQDIREHTEKGWETIVKLGEEIGKCADYNNR